MAVFRACLASQRRPHHAPQQLLAGVLAGRDLGAAACAMAPEPINSLPSTRVEILRRANSALLRMTTQTKRLPLGELEALARALLAVLLAFLHAGIAGQKAVLAKCRAQFRVEAADGAGESHAHRAGLPADAAALGRGHDIHLLRDAGELQRLGGVMTPGMIREILIDFAAVHREFAGTGPQEHASHGFLAAAGAENPSLCAHNGRFHCTQCSSSKTCADETTPRNLIDFTPGLLPAKAPLRKEPLRAENQNRTPVPPGPNSRRNLLRLLPRVSRQTGGVAVNTQFLGTARAQLVLRQHTENGFADHPIRLALAEALGGNFLQSTGIAAVRVVNLLIDLVSGHANLVRINDDQVVAGIEIGREAGLILSD